jgi:ribokinase
MSVTIIGSLNYDVVASVPALPRAGETIAALRVDHFPGGKGLNQAVAAARCGAVVRFIGAIGPDHAGAAMRTCLEDAGVDVSGLCVIAGEASGHGFVRVAANGDNSIVVALGANLALTPSRLRAADQTDGGVLLTQLEIPIATVEAGLRAAPHATRILNAAPAEPEARRLFALCDAIVVNELECGAFAARDVDPANDREVAAAARALATSPEQAVIVTLGARGALAVRGEATIRVAVRPAVVMDTVGAGDCFCGALAARLDAGADLEKALRFANAAASLSTERAGAAPSMPSIELINGAL